MTVTGPRVRDFTEPPASFAVDVVHGEALEALLSLVVAGTREEDDDYEVGEALSQRIKDGLSPEALAMVERFTGCGEVWLSLIGVAADLPEPRTIDALVETLRKADPVALRRDLLAVACYAESAPVELLDAAAAEPAAAAGLLEAAPGVDPGVIELLEMTPEGSVDELILVLESMRQTLDRDSLDVIAAEAEHSRTLAATLPAARFIESVTNGITLEERPDVTGVVLVPSVIVRPWALIAGHGSKRIVCYSVPDERMEADPDAPPAWLVEFHKALGDERRLRILGMLKEGPATFGEVTRRLELAKSTVHHHLRVLRTAGLIRVVLGEEKVYALREGVVPEAARILDAFLAARV